MGLRVTRCTTSTCSADSSPSLLTMYIYRGKLFFSPSDSQNATYEGITIMFPSGFHLGDPVYTCWQWTESGNSANVPCWLTGTIESANSDIDDNKITFYGGSCYWFDTTTPHHFLLTNNEHDRFDGTLSDSNGAKKLLIMVRSGNVIGNIDTKLVFKSDSKSTIDPGFIVPRIYLGRLANWAPYSIDELLLIVIPGRIVGEGNEICTFWQWTIDGNGVRKRNADITFSKMANVKNVGNSVSFIFNDGHHTFHASVNLKETTEQQRLTLAFTNPEKKSTGSLTLELQDLGPYRQLRGVDDDTTVAVNDTNKIVGHFPNEGSSSLTRSLVEMGSKMVGLTNMRLELSEKLNVLLEEAVQDREGIIAQLESKLRAAEVQIELLNKKLLEIEAARERDGVIAQDTQNQKDDSDIVTARGESESELSDDEENHNQSLLYDLKVDEFQSNQPT